MPLEDIQILTNKPLKISVIDALGKTIIEIIDPTENEIVLNLGSYPEGLYALRVDYATNCVSKLLVKNNTGVW